MALSKAKVTLRNREDVINDDILASLARELGDEWKKLASVLNIKKMRIQAILRNNMANDKTEDDAKFDMLVTWAKRVPKGMSKVCLSVSSYCKNFMKVESIVLFFVRNQKGYGSSFGGVVFAPGVFLLFSQKSSLAFFLGAPLWCCKISIQSNQ